MPAPCERIVADITYELAMFGLWSWALRAPNISKNHLTWIRIIFKLGPIKRVDKKQV